MLILKDEWLVQIITLTLDYIFLGDLKQFIWYKTNIAPCQQHLHGWKKEPQTSNTILQMLDLPRENTLYLSSLSQDGDSSHET